MYTYTPNSFLQVSRDTDPVARGDHEERVSQMWITLVLSVSTAKPHSKMTAPNTNSFAVKLQPLFNSWRTLGERDASQQCRENSRRHKIPATKLMNLNKLSTGAKQEAEEQNKNENPSHLALTPSASVAMMVATASPTWVWILRLAL